MNALFWVMGMVGGKLVLNVEEVASVLGIAKGTVYNRVNAGTFPIPMRKQGTQWFADARDIAEHIDSLRAEARKEFEALKIKLS